MAETSGFFPDVSGDREYTSDWLAKYIASIVGNGVYNGELAATADGSAMSVTLPSGRAWINGYHYRNDGDMKLTIDNADGVLNRIDIIVLRWDVNARSITAQVIKGTPASTAIAPAITRTVEQYDLKLAEISIPAGTTAITQSLITDCRLDRLVCGIVTGVIDQVDTTTFYNQIQADLAAFKSGSEADFSTWSAQQKASFDSWFAGIKDILDANEAGNLLNLINDHKADTVSHVTQAEHDSIASAIQGATFGGEAVPIKGKALDIPMPTAEQIEALPLYKKTVAITKDTTLSSDKSGYLIMVSSANIATVTLPSPSTRAQYDIFSNANPFVLSTSAAIFDLVTGVLGVQTLTIPVWRYIRITTDGASWIILGGDRASYASGSIALTTPALRNIQASSAQASSYLGLGNINVVIL
ncbi:hypothetical protein FL966_01825 [Caproiciproducens galactitolivorans]|nr:hypothetical protein FL966_01825 [Caproiciproducens galactitolivorans]